MANSLPHNNPINTHVVLIGISLYCLKNKSIKAYTKSIIVADLTYRVPVFSKIIFWILPPFS